MAMEDKDSTYCEAYAFIEKVHVNIGSFYSNVYATLLMIEQKVTDDTIQPDEIKKQIRQILKARNDFQEELKWQENQKSTN